MLVLSFYYQDIHPSLAFSLSLIENKSLKCIDTGNMKGPHSIVNAVSDIHHVMHALK